MFQNVTTIVNWRLIGILSAVAALLVFGESSGQSRESEFLDTTGLSSLTIRNVEFTGKFRLRRYILYREIDSKHGQPFDLELLERDRRKVDGFGIFSKIDTYLLPDGDSIDIEFELREVWTLLPLLAIGRTDGKLDWSVGVHEKNLLGFYLQTVILYRRFEGKNSGHIAATFPRLLGKDIAVGFAVADQREIDPLQFHGVRYDYDYLRKAVSGSLGHRLSENWYVQGYGGYDRENWQLITPDSLGLAVKNVDYPRYSIGTGATLGRVYFDRYFYEGDDVSIDVTGVNELNEGSFNKWRASITGRKYIISGPVNFALRLRFQTSSADERVQPYAISGESNVRGTPEKVERGDQLLLGNFETRWRTLDTRVFYGQLAAFIDYGNIWGRSRKFSDAVSDPYYSVGVGIRGSIKQFLGRIGRLDVALNPRDGSFSLYVSTSQFF